MKRPRLALVPGEPAGIGPELCARALRQPHAADLVVIGDRMTLKRSAESQRLPYDWKGDTIVFEDRQTPLIEIPDAVAVSPGSPDPRNAQAVIAALLRAAEGCLNGEFDGMVTGPVSKSTINAGGIAYRGTTELLAEHARCDVVMMLANRTMRVALATTHLPLRQVADAVTTKNLERVVRILATALRNDFGMPRPRIAVLGLNPHAGENGHLGHEENDVIIPLLRRLRSDGMDLLGPLPADTAFLPSRIRDYDAVLAMYHDQGLPVLKHSGFEQAVNLTLGLPYPRVAVDHGTAFEIAGKGIADASSLTMAIETCAAMAIARSARE